MHTESSPLAPIPTIRVGILEDQEWMLRGLVATFDRPPELHVAWSARTDAEAREHVAQDRADVLIVDHRLGGRGIGVDLAGEWIRIWPGCRIVLLTGHEDAEIARRAREVGLAGFLLKRVSDRLEDAVRTVAAGGSWFEDVELPWHLLSPAEVCVIQALNRHGSAKVAATTMNPPLSTRTVENHLQRIFQKLGLHSTREILRRYRLERDPFGRGG